MHTIVILTDGEAPDERLTEKLGKLFPECRIEVRSKKQAKAGRIGTVKQRSRTLKQR